MKDLMNTKTILIAEDSNFSIRDLKRKLSNWQVPHDLVIATDGQQAIDLLDPDSPDHLEMPPDLLILDLNMPRVPGLDVLAFVREQECYAGLPVAILTTSDSPYDIDLALMLQVDEYMIKGASSEEMCAILDRLLNAAQERDFLDAEKVLNDFD